MKKWAGICLLLLSSLLFGATSYQVIVSAPRKTVDSVLAAGTAIDSIRFGKSQVSHADGSVAFIVQADSLGDTLQYMPLEQIEGVEVFWSVDSGVGL